jgi:hypothetical protein
MVGRLGYGLLLSLFCSLAAPAHGVTGESRFVGVHQLGVNRVSDKRRAGSVTITKTVGKFIFRVTKGRKFWRLYQVNGQDCVCDDNCGNDFCYVDIDLQTQPARAQ